MEKNPRIIFRNIFVILFRKRKSGKYFFASLLAKTKPVLNLVKIGHA